MLEEWQPICMYGCSIGRYKAPSALMANYGYALQVGKLWTFPVHSTKSTRLLAHCTRLSQVTNVDLYFWFRAGE